MKWRNRQREQKNPTRRRLKAYAAALELQAPPGHVAPADLQKRRDLFESYPVAKKPEDKA